MSELWYKHQGEVLTLSVYVQPGASRNEIIGLHNGLLKIKLRSPPTEGKANKALIKYLSDVFEIPLRQVTLIKGLKSRHKQVELYKTLICPARLMKF